MGAFYHCVVVMFVSVGWLTLRERCRKPKVFPLQLSDSVPANDALITYAFPSL